VNPDALALQLDGNSCNAMDAKEHRRL